MSNDADAQQLRQYAQMVRSGNMPAQETVSWMRQTAEDLDLDYDILVEGNRTGSAIGGVQSGASFGFGDELRGAGAAIIPGGRDYTEGRDRSRKVARSQEFMNPNAYLGGQVAGGVGASFVPMAGQIGRGAQLGAKGSTMVRAALTGGGEGALAAYGEQEGSNNPLNAGVALGAGLGAGGGAVGDLFMRSIFRRPEVRKAAQGELERLMADTGKTADQVIAELGDGSLVAKNQTLQAEAKALYNEASPEVRKEVLDGATQARDAGRRGVVAAASEQTPFPSARPDFTAATDVPDTAPRYAQAYQAGNEALADGVPPDLMESVERMAFHNADVVPLINANAKAAFEEGGGDPRRWTDIVKVTDNGLQWLRDPSAQELAAVNRSVRDAVSGMYKNPNATASMAKDRLNTLQKDYRTRLGEVLPEWGAITDEVSASESARDAYDLAASIGGSPNNADKFLMAWPEFTETQKEAARAALADELSRRMAKAGPSASPTRAMMPDEGGAVPHLAQVLEVAFPGQDLPAALQRSQGAQTAYNALTGGSQTSELLSRQGQRAGGGAGDYAASLGVDLATGSPGAATLTRAAMDGGRKLIRMLGINDQRVIDETLKAMMTHDPQTLQRALQGDRAASQRTLQYVSAIMSGLSSQGAQGGGERLRIDMAE